MNSFAIATKIWAKAQKENNRLILENCSLEDVRIFVQDSNIKGVAKNEVALVNAIMRNAEFKRIQAAKQK